MRKKCLRTFCIIVVILALSTICTAARTIEVTDMAGRHVTVPFDPDRIVCIGPGTLRLIVYLQAEAKVVGVEDMEKRNPVGRPYWIAHPELSKLPRCGPGGPAGINKKPEFYRALRAFSTGRVYTLHPFNWYTTNIGTALADAYAIGKILYEKQFEDIDPQQRADEIYTFLVGNPVYRSMQKEYGPIGQNAEF